MLLRDNWNPSEIDDFVEKYRHLEIPADGKVAADVAVRLQLQYTNYISELGVLCAQAQLHAKRCKLQRDNEYTLAFLTSRATSDKQREHDARQQLKVKVAEDKLSEAEAYHNLLENRRKDAYAKHYALRLIVKVNDNERFL